MYRDLLRIDLSLAKRIDGIVHRTPDANSRIADGSIEIEDEKWLRRAHCPSRSNSSLICKAREAT